MKSGLGKKRTIYAKSLVTLRQKEDELVRDQMDGLNVYVAGSADVNFLFDRYISTKTELRSTTKANYLYTWDHFIRDTFGKKKIKDVKYSDVLFFYTDLITNKGLQVNTLESINTVLRPTFELAVRDDIIRRNPVNGAYAEVKKRNGGARKSRRALTVEQQREFIDYVAKNPIFLSIGIRFFCISSGLRSEVQSCYCMRLRSLHECRTAIGFNPQVLISSAETAQQEYFQAFP